MKTTYFIKTLLLTCCPYSGYHAWPKNVSVTQLKTEQLSNPMGIDTASPRLGMLTGIGQTKCDANSLSYSAASSN